MCVLCHLSAFILSVTTGSVSFFSRSHMWMLEAASSTQKTAGLVWAHCSETTGSPAVLFFHSATGCSRLTTCSLMLPSPQPTWHRGNEGLIQYTYIIFSIYGTLCMFLYTVYDSFISMCVECCPVCPALWAYRDSQKFLTTFIVMAITVTQIHIYSTLTNISSFCAYVH